jgi:hypothetical protein
MPVVLFNAGCRTESNSEKFGLCDDPPPARNPAYIQESDELKWIAIVKNADKAECSFYAIDHCHNVIMLRPDGKQEKRCDGMLHYDNNIIFVELKDRNRNRLGGGRKQLAKTIQAFFDNYDKNNYNKIEAYISNKQRHPLNKNNTIEIQKFKNDTGLILNVSKEITLK